MVGNVLSAFYSPYIQFLVGAAYSIQQTLDGLHIHSSNFVKYNQNGNIIGSYWSASEATYLPLGMLLFISIFICFCIILSGYVIGRRKGVAFSALVICAPGLASVVGFAPQLNLIPHEYVIGGTGVLGEVPGMIPLVILALAFGWSIAIIGMDLFSLGERYRNTFDHVWYSMAIITGLFFVGDNAASRLEKELAEASESRRFAAGYLAQQLRDYSRECQSKEQISNISCEWANFFQQRLVEYSQWPSALFYKIGPTTTADLYKIGWEPLATDRIVALRKEIATVNNEKCPIADLGNGVRRFSRPSDFCQVPPSAICSSYPEPLDGIDGSEDMMTTVHVASECIVPSIVQFKKNEERLAIQIDSISRSKHSRWLFYIFFSILAGFKVASATAKTFDFDRRENPERNRICQLMTGGLNRLWRLARASCSLPRRLATVVLRRWL